MAGDQSNQDNALEARNGILAGTVSYGNNGGTVDGYLALPNDHQPHPGVVLIQEWWGLDDFVKDMSERLARNGYIVLAPDLYHGKVVHEPNEAEKAMMQLNMGQAVTELSKGLDYLTSRDDVQPKKVGVVGFCMGGTLAWNVAIQNNGKVGAVAPFYAAGFEPKADEIAKVTAPILAVYGDHDPYVPAETRTQIIQTLEQEGKTHKALVYNAGHAFLNPDHGDLVPDAAEQAWNELLAFFKQYL